MKVFLSVYWVALGILIGYAGKEFYYNGWEGFLSVGYYASAVGLLAILSAQYDLVHAMYRGKIISVRARALDFIHWFLLIFMTIGRWMAGGQTIWTFWLMVAVLMMIGWSIGVGIRRQYRPSANEKKAAMVGAALALTLGLVAGYIRGTDPSPRGWGWALESGTAVVATIIVFNWIMEDMRVIRLKAADYPRSMFLKGILSNTLVIWFWWNLMVTTGGFTAENLVTNLGVTFNTVIGNILYLAYYILYEYYRHKEK